MPLSEEQQALGFALAMPMATGAVTAAMFYNDKAGINWFKELKRPNWTVGGDNAETFHCVMDSLVTVPLVYSTQYLWKFSGGLDDDECRHAMIHYAAAWGLSVLYAPILKKRSLLFASINAGAIFVNSLCLFHSYKQVHRHAAYSVLPYSILAAYYALLFGRLYCLNKEEKKQK